MSNRNFEPVSSTGKLGLMLAAWLVSLAGAFSVGAYVYRHPTTTPSLARSAQPSQNIETSLYNLRVQLVAVPPRVGTEGLHGSPMDFFSRTAKAGCGMSTRRNRCAR